MDSNITGTLHDYLMNILQVHIWVAIIIVCIWVTIREILKTRKNTY